MNSSEELACVQWDRPSVLWCLYKFAYVSPWGHRKWCCVMSPLSSDQEILRRLEKEKILVFTPSRRVQGRRVVCYDDRFIVKLACDSDGIIVSNDNYRDLQNEKPEWKKFIEERLLMYSFVNDKYACSQLPWWRGFLSFTHLCLLLSTLAPLWHRFLFHSSLLYHLCQLLSHWLCFVYEPWFSFWFVCIRLISSDEEWEQHHFNQSWFF